MKTMKLLYSCLAACLFAVAITAPFGLSALGIIGGATGTIALSALNNQQGVAFAGLNKEIWLSELMEGFYADDMFLSECRDLSAFVDNDIINLAEAGVNPDVLINNTTYPIAVNERADGALTLEIDNFDTENQSVKAADLVELAYDKLSSIVYGHKQALRMKIMEKGADAIAPATDGTFTPIVTATGADNGNGLKRLTWADVRSLQKKFNNAEIPAEGRIIVLSQQHLEDLEVEDLDRFNRMMDKGVLCGFKVYSLADSRLPRYNKTTGVKVAFGAAAAPTTDSTASIAFHKDEVCRVMGSENMFNSKAENDPIYRRDVIGFSKRALVIPIRNKGVGAIYSPAV